MNKHNPFCFYRSFPIMFLDIVCYSLSILKGTANIFGATPGALKMFSLPRGLTIERKNFISTL